MTTEERFVLIENGLASIVAVQATTARQLELLGERLDKLAESQDRLTKSQEMMVDWQARISDAEERTEERLLTLIEHVDGIDARLKRVERRGKPQ